MNLKKLTGKKEEEKDCIRLQLKFKPPQFGIYKWVVKKAEADHKRGVSPMAIILLGEAMSRDEEEGFKGVI